MNLRRIIWILLVCIIALLVAGCGGGEEEASSGEGDETTAEEEMASPVDPATASTISGKVSFSGTAPDPELIQMDAEVECQEQYPDGAFTETVVVNDNGTLQNVFVYLKDGLGDLNFPVPSEGVVLDQQGCRYIPHVFGVQVGQDLIIRNSDGLLHNIHTMPEINKSINFGQPVEIDTIKTIDEVEVMIPVECDVHDWMVGYIGALDHPYFATTGADGAFSLPNLPPGDYEIEVWHEEYGTQTMNVTVGESETVDIEFTYEGG